MNSEKTYIDEFLLQFEQTKLTFFKLTLRDNRVDTNWLLAHRAEVVRVLEAVDTKGD